MIETTQPGLSRETWLRAAAHALGPRFEPAGYKLPARIRFSIGFTSTGRKGSVAECWHSDASADHHHEIFIRADQADPATVLGILAHELVHAAVPLGSAHGPVYRAAALAIGLAGKMTYALPGPAFAAELQELAARLGPLPHARLDLTLIDSTGTGRGRGTVAEDRPKKQGTRMLKAECGQCGYTVRITRKWLDGVGAPHCPNHGAMAAEGWAPGETSRP
jgi:hypothetical protein